MENEIDGIRKEAFEQFEIIRKSSRFNMITDINNIYVCCEIRDFIELLDVIDDKKYRLLTRNYSKAKELGWI